MAYHFSANQFEDQYNARRLCNWEYPKWYPERPRKRNKTTKIIADNHGHLLEGVKKGNAWGNYLGTWDLPRRITREFAEKLAAPPERASRWQKKVTTATEEAATESSGEQQPKEQERVSDEKIEEVSKASSDEVVECGGPPSWENIDGTAIKESS
ncbi:UNVERIFIED_CONTAM: hypothetical protein PYX00_009537 [Menopon gallinae]|uniref:Cilia- and flagella-associated protein 126 n=1 Tax=Menopon gallinae TaxID=328185 RepID=A0AAW2HBY4_9NEOP